MDSNKEFDIYRNDNNKSRVRTGNVSSRGTLNTKGPGGASSLGRAPKAVAQKEPPAAKKSSRVKDTALYQRTQSNMSKVSQKLPTTLSQNPNRRFNQLGYGVSSATNTMAQKSPKELPES